MYRFLNVLCLVFKNSAAGIRRHMERAGVTKAVCESTGGCVGLCRGWR